MTTITQQASGFDREKLSAAIDFAITSESSMNRDIGAALEDGYFGEPPEVAKTIGPVKDRAEPGGVILYHGQEVASWGDADRVDMTFSISKSYLALLAGIAVDDGLIADIHAPVRELVRDGRFDSDQNRAITWAQLLQQTSEWQGTLWDKPDWIDHYRVVMGEPVGAPPKGTKRPLQSPGSYWEYNDVRVNVLALALLHVFRRPLPEVLKERIMDPIGASDNWQWHGYDNAWVEIDGQRMQSVSGGAHWGGGLWISARDHARVGQLMLQRGTWDGRQLVSEAWLGACLNPCPLNPVYGYMWWLNTGQKLYPAAPASSYFGLGAGSHMLWVDPEHDMVAVARWIDNDASNSFIDKVMRAVV